jgi:hypothetical protein
VRVGDACYALPDNFGHCAQVGQRHSRNLCGILVKENVGMRAGRVASAAESRRRT